MSKPSIKIFSPSLKLLGEIDLYDSFFMNRNYNELEADFQLVAGTENFNLFNINNFIMINNENEKVGVIKEKKVILNDKKEESLYIKGYALSSILNSRVVKLDNESEFIFGGNSTDLIELLLNDNLVNPKDEDRKIDNLILDIDKSLGTDMVWRVKNGQYIGDVISDICRANNLGYKIYLDFEAKKVVFKLYKGKDLSKKVIFSPELDNIRNMEYTEDNIEEKNVVYIQTSDYSTVSYGSGKGIHRSETFFKHGELGDYKSIEQIGEYHLNNFMPVKSIEGDIVSTDLLKYERDYSLGDIVTVQNRKWGMSQDLRITNLMEVYEAQPKLVFTFGDPKQPLMRRIKNRLTNIYN